MTAPVAPPSDRAADLALALELADLADGVSLPRFGALDLQVSTKPDLTPVSDADTAVERALREELGRRRPEDRIVGEEYGAYDDGPAVHARRGRCWVIDPIDGTKNFVRGVPIWATLIALLIDGRPVVGVISAPALARRWWGDADGGSFTAFAGGPTRRCAVSGVSDLADASLSLSDMSEWHRAGRGPQMRAIAAECWRVRGYGDFYSYALVAEGAVDIAAEPELSLWDVAALAPIVAGAGGRITTVDGAAITAAATSALATTPGLQQTLLARLGQAPSGG